MTDTHCPAPIEFADVVDYWAGDLPEQDEAALEEHLLGCEACSARSARVASVSETLRGLIPPIVTPEALAGLRQRGLRVLEHTMTPGERKQVVFPAQVDLLIHRLAGLELAQAARVGFELRCESDGRVLMALEDVPFDREQGAVLLACQQHYASMPPDTVAELRVRGQGGEETRVVYTILHHFAR